MTLTGFLMTWLSWSTKWVMKIISVLGNQYCCEPTFYVGKQFDNTAIVFWFVEKFKNKIYKCRFNSQEKHTIRKWQQVGLQQIRFVSYKKHVWYNSFTMINAVFSQQNLPQYPFTTHNYCKTLYFCVFFISRFCDCSFIRGNLTAL